MTSILEKKFKNSTNALLNVEELFGSKLSINHHTFSILSCKGVFLTTVVAVVVVEELLSTTDDVAVGALSGVAVCVIPWS